jgi:hypothetical protein
VGRLFEQEKRKESGIMFVKLTNATPHHKGKDIAISANSIVTIHSDSVEREIENGVTSTEKVTFLFCPPHGTWEVQESIDEVIKLVKEASK